MGRKQKKIHYIYKTTCSVNGKYYIGMHSTDRMEDGYLGSGKRLWHSINYHGKDKHTREILEYCNTREELRRREEEIVNKQLINEDLCMNLKTGGTGGFINNEHMIKCSKAGNEKLKELFNDSDFSKQHSDNISKTMKKRVSEGIYTSPNKGHWIGRQHNEETKRKISDSMKGKQNGENNSQYGTCWITNGNENKKIKKELLTTYQDKGWGRGRKI